MADKFWPAFLLCSSICPANVVVARGMMLADVMLLPCCG